MIKQFLTWLHGESVAQGLYIAIFSLPSRSSKFFRDIDAAAKYVAEVAEKEDVYVGVSPLAHAPQRGRRGDLSHVGALIGCWADFDFGPHHKKPGIPRTEGEARAILRKVGLEPSIVIFSGHGLQAWWLFETPWIFKNEKEKEEAVAFAKAFQDTVTSCAQSLKFTVDSVGDLTRVMRIPGTWNRKGDPIEVKKILPAGSEELIRKKPNDVKAILVPVEMRVENRKIAARIVQDIDPILPNEEDVSHKIQALCQNDAQFKTSWERKRTDLSDQSPSGYDLSLANKMVIAGFPDQDIANALLAWRRLHEEDEQKLFRRDYLMRTIARARDGVQSAAALEQMPAELGAPERDQMDDERKEKVLHRLRQGLGIDLKRVIKHGEENSIYSLELNNGRVISLGDIKQVMSQDRMREAVADITGAIFDLVKKPIWHAAVSYMLSIADVIQNDEYSTIGRLRQWIIAYLGNNPSGYVEYSSEDLMTQMDDSLPFLRDGQLHLSAQHLRKFIRIHFWDQISHQELCEGLRQMKYHSKKMSIRSKKSKKIVGRSYWIGPTIAHDHVEEIDGQIGADSDEALELEGPGKS